MTTEHIDGLEKKISRLIKKANKKKKKAKKAKVKCYFEGQNDAFEQILIKLKKLKNKLETHAKDDEENKEEREQQSEENKSETLLKKALEKGVIIRHTSFYLHDDLPTGKVHGKKRMLQALNESSFFEKIQHQVASAGDIIREEKKE